MLSRAATASLVLLVACTVETATPRMGTSPTASPIIVVDFVGGRMRQASVVLEETGLTVDVERKGSSTPEGTILQQDPPAGTELAEGDVVHLLVAESWPIPPFLMLSSLQSARRQLHRAGYRVEVKTRVDTTLPPGTVIDSHPSGPTKPGHVITVIVADRPAGGCHPSYSGCLPTRSAGVLAARQPKIAIAGSEPGRCRHALALPPLRFGHRHRER